jgi:hypothetical protein
MTTDNNQLTDESRIREIVEERVRAIRSKDVDALITWLSRTSFWY